MSKKRFSRREETPPICIKHLTSRPDFQPASLTTVTLLSQEESTDSLVLQGCVLTFLTSSSSEIRNMALSELLMPLCLRVQLLLDGTKKTDILGPIEVLHQKESSQDMVICLYPRITSSLVFCLQYERQYSSKILPYFLNPLFYHVFCLCVSENLNDSPQNELSLCKGVKKKVNEFLYLQEQRNEIGSSCFNLGTVSQFLPDYEQTILACLALLTERKSITRRNVLQLLNLRDLKLNCPLEEIFSNLSLMGYLEKIKPDNLEAVPAETVFQLK